MVDWALVIGIVALVALSCALGVWLERRRALARGAASTPPVVPTLVAEGVELVVGQWIYSARGHPLNAGWKRVHEVDDQGLETWLDLDPDAQGFCRVVGDGDFDAGYRRFHTAWEMAPVYGANLETPLAAWLHESEGLTKEAARRLAQRLRRAVDQGRPG